MGALAIGALAIGGRCKWIRQQRVTSPCAFAAECGGSRRSCLLVPQQPVHRESHFGVDGRSLFHGVPDGHATPYHLHHIEDEAFYVLDGEFRFVCAGQKTIVDPGGYMFLPPC